MADSGGVQPWGEAILIPCDCTLAKPNIYYMDVQWASMQDWFSDAHFMRSTGTYKVVVKDAKSTMGIRYFENNAELEAWAKQHV